jgi:hypothetical protein
MGNFETELHLPNQNSKVLPKIIPDNAGIDLKITRELDSKSLAIVSNNVEILSSQIQSSMEKDDISKFKNILKESLPKEKYEYFKNLTQQDIVNFMAIILIAVALSSTGVGLVPTITALSVRFWITTLFTRAMVTWLSRQNSVSAVMWLIPGMKMLAPNTNISLTVNAMKDVVTAIWPAMLPAVNSLTKSKPQQ